MFPICLGLFRLFLLFIPSVFLHVHQHTGTSADKCEEISAERFWELNFPFDAINGSERRRSQRSQREIPEIPEMPEVEGCLGASPCRVLLFLIPAGTDQWQIPELDKSRLKSCLAGNISGIWRI